MDSTSRSTDIPVTLKWNKQLFSLAIHLGEMAIDLKQRVETATGVPVARQKLMAKKGGWKGALKDDVILDAATIKETSSFAVTLIGSAETLSGPTQKTTFLEDLTPEELRAAEDAQAQEAMGSAEGMIQAVQFPPHRRDDHKQEMYQYNRLVTGLPQRQIEQELKHGQGENNGELQGKVVMTLGLELRRAYMNDLAVLEDGTCVSVMDDGHVQLWKHGAQQQDVVHAPGAEGGVDSVVALRRKHSSAMAFATTGRGVIQFWSADGDRLVSLMGGMPGTTPSSLVAVYGGSTVGANTTSAIVDDEVDATFTCLATRFQVTRQVNPSQFRLPPQNEEERRRRAQAEAQERAVQEALGKAARSIQVWYSIASSTTNSSKNPQALQSKILEPRNGSEGAAPITCLACVSIPGQQTRLLVAGDSRGGLRLWEPRRSSINDLAFEECGFYQLAPPSSGCSIVCMEPLQDGRLVVSTDIVNAVNSGVGLFGATALPTHAARAVHILAFSVVAAAPTIQTTLTGHVQDAVICMCPLPDGSLLTGGGKLDATLQLWSRAQVDGTDKDETRMLDTDAAIQAQPKKILSDVGYVFALAVLPDAKKDSNFYAVAAGRYNAVKIVI